jgi:hypothetical protein
MTINLRFFVRKEDYCIIDRLNPAAKYLVRYCWEDAPEALKVEVSAERAGRTIGLESTLGGVE